MITKQPYGKILESLYKRKGLKAAFNYLLEIEKEIPSFSKEESFQYFMTKAEFLIVLKQFENFYELVKRLKKRTDFFLFILYLAKFLVREGFFEDANCLLKMLTANDRKKIRRLNESRLLYMIEYIAYIKTGAINLSRGVLNSLKKEGLSLNDVIEIFLETLYETSMDRELGGILKDFICSENNRQFLAKSRSKRIKNYLIKYKLKGQA